MKTLIKNGLLIDPANQVQAYLNLILEDGKVVAVTEEEPEAIKHSFILSACGGRNDGRI